MSFYDIYRRFENFDFKNFFNNITDDKILHAINKDTLDESDFLSLLSDKAYSHIELMAKRSRDLTLKHFGKIIHLYTPLYLSNYCENECAYCGFKNSNEITRKKLSYEEVEKEAKAVFETGIKHILILTGESREDSPVSYIKDCVKILKKYFTSISIEIYPLAKEEYAELISAGVDGLTIYQETYNERLYGKLHLKGPKSDYKNRLDAPERACNAHIRSVSVGALLGLSEFRKESFFAGLHAYYLQNKYPDAEISVSLPRVQPQTGDYKPEYEVSDKNLVQLMLALRIFMPRAGINISTREKESFRDNLIGIGVTRISAGSRTEVGGYFLHNNKDGQFCVADKRSVEEIKNMIYSKGFQPVFKDWQSI